MFPFFVDISILLLFAIIFRVRIAARWTSYLVVRILIIVIIVLCITTTLGQSVYVSKQISC
jgi:hypothetical protein